jgi:hypothetical protein
MLLDKSFLLDGLSIEKLFWFVNNNNFDMHNISLELRVKEKLLRYPEEVFFAS